MTVLDSASFPERGIDTSTMMPIHPPRFYDAAVAIDWTYDWDFVRFFEHACGSLGLGTYIVSPENLEKTLVLCREGKLRFRFLFDRASDTSPEFLRLHAFLVQNDIPVLDSIERLRSASDKAEMHLLFYKHGVTTPYTRIIPPYEEQPELTLTNEELDRIGRPCVMKPARTTGGGIGMVDNVMHLFEVRFIRQRFADNPYLLQQKIEPHVENGRRFWFRGFYCCGMVDAVWWDNVTHIYDLLTDEAVRVCGLEPIFTMIQEIAALCGLHFFSTEIARDAGGCFYVVDYVNEICDMRLKSRHRDGVPDAIVVGIADRLAQHIKRVLAGNSEGSTR